VLNLPATPGVAGVILLVLGLIAGVVCGVLLWRELRGSTTGLEARLAAAALAVAVGTTVAGAPFIAWRIFEDVRLNSRLTRAQAERIGGDSVGIDHRAIDQAARVIPSGDTYFVALPRDMEIRRLRNARRWALTALLPRIEVYDSRKADWVFAWGRDPRSAGVRVVRVVRLGPESGYALAQVAR
jgi:hypothetical protein